MMRSIHHQLTKITDATRRFAYSVLDKTDPLAIDRPDYPSGRTIVIGENLRQLSRDQSAYVPPRRFESSEPAIDAIIVPTIRPVNKNKRYIRRIMRTVGELPRTSIVFLCSGKAHKEDIARIAEEFPDVTWTAIEGNYTDYNEAFDLRTTHSAIALDGFSDLAAKRNMAIRIARRMGWQSIFLLDDDLTITTGHIKKAADLLGQGASVVAYSVSKYWDHSAAVYAYRWTGGAMDCFVGGGAMAVKTDGAALAFFPQIYDEDWLFGLTYSLYNDGLVWAGTLRQRRQKPFRIPDRAFIEEPGDLLAESLFSLAMSIKPVKSHRSLQEALAEIIAKADKDFWQREITRRIIFVQKTMERIRKRPEHIFVRRRALKALSETLRALVGENGKGGITPDDLTAWLKDWSQDLDTWELANQKIGGAKLIPEAIRSLDITQPYIYKESTVAKRESSSPSMPPLSETELLRELPEKPRPQYVIKGMLNTSLVEHYMAERNLSMSDLVKSANRLRWERPAFHTYRPQPAATIGILVANGESMNDIVQTVQNIVAWNGKKRSVQLVIWVYDEYPMPSQSLEAYRSNLALRLLDELEGTQICLCTSHVRNVAGLHLDQIIQSVSEELVLGYWVFGIDHTDHPVFVINSIGEALRWGNFWQLVDQQHRIPNKSLKEYFQDFPLTPNRASRIAESIAKRGTSQKADALSRNIVYKRIFSSKHWQGLSLRTRFQSPTRKLVKHMRTLGISWIRINDDAYEFRCHTLDSAELPFTKVKKSYCLPIMLKSTSVHNVHECYRHIRKTITESNLPTSSSSGKINELAIIIYYEPTADYEAVQTFRDTLMELLLKKWAHGNMLVSSLVFLANPEHNARMLRRNTAVTMQYIHWIETPNSPTHIKWLRPHLLRFLS